MLCVRARGKEEDSRHDQKPIPYTSVCFWSGRLLSSFSLGVLAVYLLHIWYFYFSGEGDTASHYGKRQPTSTVQPINPTSWKIKATIGLLLCVGFICLYRELVFPCLFPIILASSCFLDSIICGGLCVESRKLGQGEAREKDSENVSLLKRIRMVTEKQIHTEDHSNSVI